MRTLLVLLFALPLFAGCDESCVEGTGDLTTQEHAVGDFSRIDLDTSGTVVLTSGEPGFVAHGDSNLLNRLEIFVRGGTLNIRDKSGRCLEATDGLLYEVSTPEVRRLSVSGDGIISASDTLVTPALRLDVSGSGELEVDTDTSDLETNISGSGTVYVSGKAHTHDVQISGSGELWAFELETTRTDLSISGSGSARVFVTQSLDADVSGSGDVRYRGNPSVHTDISGSGSVRRVE